MGLDADQRRTARHTAQTRPGESVPQDLNSRDSMHTFYASCKMLNLPTCKEDAAEERPFAGRADLPSKAEQMCFLRANLEGLPNACEKRAMMAAIGRTELAFAQRHSTEAPWTDGLRPCIHKTPRCRRSTNHDLEKIHVSLGEIVRPCQVRRPSLVDLRHLHRWDMGLPAGIYILQILGELVSEEPTWLFFSHCPALSR
nr:hypothetical protein CFP56_20274 [Quercus suber]